RAVLVLLSRPAPDAAGAFGDAVPDDGHGALARNHVPPFGGGDALDDRTSRPLGQLTARPREAGRGDGLALRAVDAGPDGAVHAVEGDQASASVAHGHADLDVEFARLVESGLYDAIGVGEGESHVISS